MDPVAQRAELAEPYLGAVLAQLGLDVEYVRGEGNTLFYRNDQHEDVPVLDMVGGFGSTILGHNHPEIVSYAKSLLDEGRPVHVQFSKHPYANELAWSLNGIMERELGTSEPFRAIFSNSGAEAVEVAIKHAELDRVMKVGELAAGIENNVGRARSAVRAGARLVTGDAADVVGDDGELEAVVARVEAHNRQQMAASPVFLAPEGSFHGKLVGSIQLTHNPGFRTPFTALAAPCRFVSLDEPDALAAAADAERRELLDLAVDGRVVRVVRRDLPVICAFVLEPIQGEAGIRILDRDVAGRIREVCASIGCPIIVDEVQSGMGRSGAFFASSHVGLTGDYYLLAKSLGGGLAKAAVTLVRASHVRDEFELVHSSTFAKDGFSTLIAQRTVDLLEAGDGEAYRLAEERGSRLLAMLGDLHKEHGDVLKEVRGRGLMIGLEFQDQSGSPSEPIREQAQAGLLGYLLSGYLLREHRIRILPTASATNTLRFEPSVYLTDTEIAHLESGLRGLIAVLREQDGGALLPG